MQAYNLKPQAVVGADADADASAAALPPDFDFQMPCRLFKSSFARSLSLTNNNNNNNGSSNLANSNSSNNNNNNAAALALAKRGEKPQQQLQHQQQQQQQIEANASHFDANDNEQLLLSVGAASSTLPPALPARRPNNNNNNNRCNANNTSCNFGLEHSVTHFGAATANQLSPQQQQQLQLQKQQQAQHRNLANFAWPLQDANSNGGAPNNLNYELLPQQQVAATAPHEQTLNVEAVILKNQVDTLQWQLKQTETNCEMYRAVMEEVARFFERYQLQQQQLRQQQLQQQQQQHSNRNSLGGAEQIARSKSLHHVHGVGSSSILTDPNGAVQPEASSSSGSSSYLRARSSTNLMLNKSMLTMNEEQNYETIAPAGSYNAFKDFTWRRSPKKLGGVKCRLTALEDAEEKLNQEAFRLARTIRNLLHTSQQQPDLTQPRHSLSSLNSLALGSVGRLCKANNSSVLTLLAPPLHNSTSIEPTLGMQSSPSPVPAASKGNSVPSAEMLFLRANNMRDSRLSLRSSTDSSVHSTISSTASSSSKTETDEENTHVQPKATKAANGSSTEDESGFSSISSFHDVGLPLSSTLIEHGNNRRLSVSTESRNSTLKSTLAAAHPNNVVGVPLQPQHSPSASTVSSQCSSVTPSQSPSKTYRNANRYQRFSTLSNEDAAAVLWV